MIKLIVSDVDGTLVEDGSADINPELFEVNPETERKGDSVCHSQRTALVQCRAYL